MKVGAFELQDPIPDLRDPHVFVVLRPWVDVGSVGTLSLNLLERLCGAQEMGRLRMPGMFYDFTRYRPNIRYKEGLRSLTIPTTVIRYAEGPQDNDFLFLHSMEPHAFGETFVKSLSMVLEKLRVKRYVLVGGVYGTAPHTRPLPISGVGMTSELRERMTALGFRTKRYEGPASIISMVTEGARRQGAEILSALVNLPQYAQLDEDFTGQYCLLSFISSLYDWNLDIENIRRLGEQQYTQLVEAIESDIPMQWVVKRLEEAYDAGIEQGQGSDPVLPSLNPELERLLWEIDDGYSLD